MIEPVDHSEALMVSSDASLEDSVGDESMASAATDLVVPKLVPETLNPKLGYPAMGGDGVYYTDDPSVALKGRVGELKASDTPQLGVIEMLRNRVLATPDAVSHCYDQPQADGGSERVEKTWREFWNDVRSFAKSSRAIGGEFHKGVITQGFPSYMGSVATIGSIMARMVPTGVYPTSLAHRSEFLANKVEAQVIVVEDETQLQKYFKANDDSQASQPEHVKAYVVWGKVSQEFKELADKPVYSWQEYMAQGVGVDEDEVSSIWRSASPSECAVVVPTSGTTGEPKASMLSHDNITWLARNVTQLYDLNDTDSVVAFLPPSHIAGMMADLFVPIACGAKVTYAPDALPKKTLTEYLKAERPTVMLAVPRLFEKMMEGVEAQLEGASALKKRMFKTAMKSGFNKFERDGSGARKPNMFKVWDKLVLSKVRAALGLDRVRMLATGAAPVTDKTLNFWAGLGLPLLNLYGQSESTGVMTASTPLANRLGAAGRPLPGTEVVLLDMDDNGKQEIAVRGRGVFMGYRGQLEKTATTITPNGFLLTGDYGHFDADGYLHIDGRKKEILKTSGGEYVAYQDMEDALKDYPGISNAMMVADGYKFVSCLVTLPSEIDASGAAVLLPEAQQLFGVRTVEEALQLESVNAYVLEALNAANEKASSEATKIKKYRILDRDFGVDNGTVTETLKLKRAEVLKVYADVVAGIYAD